MLSDGYSNHPNILPFSFNPFLFRGVLSEGCNTMKHSQLSSFNPFLFRGVLSAKGCYRNRSTVRVSIPSYSGVCCLFNSTQLIRKHGTSFNPFLFRGVLSVTPTLMRTFWVICFNPFLFRGVLSDNTQHNDNALIPSFNPFLFRGVLSANHNIATQYIPYHSFNPFLFRGVLSDYYIIGTYKAKQWVSIPSYSGVCCLSGA